MAKPLFFFLPKLILCAFLFLSITKAARCRFVGDYCPKKPVVLLIFGDSFFDPGNNNYINTTTLDQANFWPYGKTYFNYPTGRFSDGRLISDFIAEYAKIPMVPPYLQPESDRNFQHGVNFASAGAGALAETFHGEVIDLGTQLKYYEKFARLMRKKLLGKFKSKIILSRAVYLFSIGTNDYLSPILETNSSAALTSQYADMVIGNITSVVKAMYKRGGRKFVFMNLGDLGCLPGLRILNPQRGGGCFEEASKISKLHNVALENMLFNLEKQLDGFKYLLYDFNTALKEKMNNPSKYGFKEGEKACCGTGKFNGIFSCGGKRAMIKKEFEVCENPNGFIFWDSYHLTEMVYKQMAHQIWSSNGPLTTPFNLHNLLYCL